MKKVLASVLAGSMVLGMASMANAAVIVKSSGSNDYDFVFNAYESKYGEREVTLDLVDVLEGATVDALNEYEANYSALEKMAKNGGTSRELVAVAEDLLTSYDALRRAIGNDKYINAASSDVKGELNTALSKTSTQISIGTTGTGFITGEVTAAPSGVTAAEITTSAAALRLLDTLTSPSALRTTLGALMKVTGGLGGYRIAHRDSIELQDARGNDFNLYTYGDDCDEITIRLAVAYDEDLRVDVASGDVTVSRKLVTRNSLNKRNNVDLYDITVKAAAGVRDFELDDYKIEFDCHDANLVFYLEGDVAYSDYREIAPDERYINKESTHIDDHTDGCVYNFSEVIDEETRIICNDYVDVMLKGNYGTDYENMRVLDDDIKEVEDFFQDYDIDYYDFIGTPKFAKDVTVRIDADSDSYIYEFDKKTGDVVDITDECDYTSDGWTFKRKNLKTYVVLEEPYEGGNVRADKEPVDTEPIDEPDDIDATGSKPNPGTGAMPF